MSTIPARTGRPGTGRALDAFIERVCALPPAAWLAVGTTMLARTPETQAHDDAARDALARAIDARRLGVAAWYVCDSVRTAAWIARSTPGHCATAADRRRADAACEAVEAAALSFLAGPWLPPETLTALRAPLSAHLSASR